MRIRRALATLALAFVSCGQTTGAVTPASPSLAASASPSPATPVGLWPRSTPLAHDSTHGYVMLFSGNLNRGTAAGDTWIWKSGRWTQLHPKSNPVGRSGAVLVDDPEMHAVLLYGGGTASGQSLDDTWAWNGDNWVELFPAHKPPARFGAAATFDTVRHVVLMFGGSGRLHDTWTWNGQDWTEADTATSPPGRAYGRLAVDVGSGSAVLFGGFEALQDTWTWDGRTWTQLQTSNTPPGIHEATAMTEQMAYDATRNVIVLAAPNETTNSFETYVWKSGDWIRLNPAASPPFRDGSGLAYDAGDSIIVLAGGYGRGSVDSTATWGFDGINWSTIG